MIHPLANSHTICTLFNDTTGGRGGGGSGVINELGTGLTLTALCDEVMGDHPDLIILLLTLESLEGGEHFQ